jgi:hypothetical protein
MWGERREEEKLGRRERKKEGKDLKTERGGLEYYRGQFRAG